MPTGELANSSTWPLPMQEPLFLLRAIVGAEHCFQNNRIRTIETEISDNMQPDHSDKKTHSTQGTGGPRAFIRRVLRSLDDYSTHVLVLCPIIVSLLTGAVVWWLLGTVFDLGTQHSVVTAAVASAMVFSCGVFISLYLKSLLRRYGLLRSALNVVDASLIIYDEQGRVALFNRSAYRYHEQRGTKLRLGMTDNQLIDLAAVRRFDNEAESEQWKTEILHLRQTHLDSGQPITVKTYETSEHRDTTMHETRYQQVILAKLRAGYVDMRTDVTELKSSELELAERETDLRKSRNEAQASNRAKSEFLANMSHEIRTPMNGVIGMTELLLESELSSEQRLFATTISSSSLALLSLINDILDFSKVEAGRLHLESLSFDLKKVFDDAGALLATRAHAKGVELVTNYSPELPQRFFGDADRLRQVINNLAGNAVKFTDSGHVAMQVTGRIENDTASLTFDFTDTGIGIPEDKQAGVFSVFEQVDGASNRRFEGTGLGLAIARRLVNLMGGDITLKSEVGVGSTFSFEVRLPVDNHTANDASPLCEADLSGRTVLIVDDLPLTCEILSRRVQAWGMQPLVAQSGKEAMKIATQTSADAPKIDVAIFDFQMPHLDGHELSRRFKKMPALADIPIVLLSSVDHSVQGERVRELGFVSCLMKPVRSEVLFDDLARALGSESPQHRSPTRTNNVTTLIANGTPDNKRTVTSETEAGEAGTPLHQDAENSDAVQAGSNLLIVEDNTVNQLVISSMLESRDYEFEIADNGRLGLESYKMNQPSLILMDISMPEMNGMQATEHIREFEKANGLAHCPIIALTANAMKGDRERCISSGMDDFLSKPVLMEDLFAMLDKWLNDSQQQLPNAEGF